MQQLSGQRIGSGLQKLNLDQITDRNIPGKMDRLQPRRFAEPLAVLPPASVNQHTAAPPDRALIKRQAAALQRGLQPLQPLVHDFWRHLPVHRRRRRAGAGGNI